MGMCFEEHDEIFEEGRKAGLKEARKEAARRAEAEAEAGPRPTRAGLSAIATAMEAEADAGAGGYACCAKALRAVAARVRGIQEAMTEPRYAFLYDIDDHAYLVPEEFVEAWLDWTKSDDYWLREVPDYALRLDRDLSWVLFEAPVFG